MSPVDHFQEYINGLANEYGRTKEFAYLFALTSFYHTMKAMPKYKSYAGSIKRTLEQINPSYAQGYFKTKI